jgi:threonine dehydratase
VVICTGGGGLLGGMGVVLRTNAPHVRVVGAQSMETAAMTRSVEQGRVVHTPVTPTLAYGLAGQIDVDALHIGQQCVLETIAWLAREEGMTVEGAGAVAVAALRHGKIATPEGPVVAILSGRNIDASRHQALLARYPVSAS